MSETGFLKKIINTITGTARKKYISDAPDEKLVELFISGNNDGAFEEIVNRYTDKIYGLALRITRNPSDAEDILQDVFLTLVNKLHTFREESKFSSWLYRVTANASYMRLRAGKKHESDLSLEDYVPYDRNGTLMGRIASKNWSERPDEKLLSGEAMDMIEKAVSELPEAYRVVFHLRDVEQLSAEQVAGVLGLSVPAVKSRLHRARLFLRDRLSDYFYERGR